MPQHILNSVSIMVFPKSLFFSASNMCIFFYFTGCRYKIQSDNFFYSFLLFYFALLKLFHLLQSPFDKNICSLSIFGVVCPDISLISSKFSPN